MQAIILAGGFGTRLQSVISDVPKPMAPVLGKPFLSYILDVLDNQGFTKVVLAVGYKKEVIQEYFKSKYKGLDILYSIEEEPLGTGGCVKQAMSYIDEEYVFILNGDTMFKIDFKEMSKLNALSIACKKMNDFDRYGEVQLNNGRIEAFAEKKYVKEGYINGGIYYLPKNIFDTFDLPNRFSMEKDFFEKYIKSLNIQAYLSDSYFIDIGIPEDYAKVQKDFARKKAVFLDRDGIINIDYGHVYQVENFVFTDFIFDLCRKYQQEGYLLLVVTNQAGIGKGLYKETDFIALSEYMVKQFEEQGILISNVYYCPHTPEDNCTCRKPKPGMFLKAIDEFNLDPLECVAIGDKLSDLEGAYQAGIRNLYYKHTSYDRYSVPFSYKELEL